MTENEAIVFIQNAMEESRKALAKLLLIAPKVFETRKKSLGEYYSHLENCKKEIQACEIAIKALGEVQQYRALGTVEDLKTMKEHGAFTGTELAQLAAMQRLREYERIGTPEECLRHNDLLDFIVDKMNPNEFEIYLQMYNALDEKGNRRASDEVN